MKAMKYNIGDRVINDENYKQYEKDYKKYHFIIKAITNTDYIYDIYEHNEIKTRNYSFGIERFEIATRLDSKLHRALL